MPLSTRLLGLLSRSGMVAGRARAARRIRRLSLRGARMCAAMGPLLLAGAAGAQGFTAGNGEYVGVALSAAEKANVTAALDKLQALATAETNAQNRATMQ